ncbi:MAG: hypothetical protein K6B74_05330 [Ruminococcus sp.]|nr:hypothetical protein [Ruminococcus sp.]
MAIIVQNIMLPLTEDAGWAISAAVKKCGLKHGEIAAADIHKISLDARKRGGEIHFVCSVYIETADPKRETELCKRVSDCRLAVSAGIEPVFGSEKQRGRVVVAGFGPAGMFAALVLAKYGYRPLVLEKGADADKRRELVERFWQTGELDESSNVQFGEGGAGTFSDGKLTTRISDPRCRFVLETFAQSGADSSILTKAKPHIGTDVLCKVVKNIRREVIAHGGEVCFETPLTGLDVSDGRVKAVKSHRGDEECAAVVIACGHSAGETFGLLGGCGVALEPKPFSVGVRIEHLREDVEKSLYGKYAGDPRLPAAEYQLSHHTAQGRGVYTFCMCPGGTVVAAASERGGVVTNGMSEFARGGRNSNAAVAVSVSPADFGSGAFDGFDFAKRIEKAAFAAGSGYAAPATTVKGFLDGKPTLSGASVEPTYARGVFACELRQLFPEFVTDSLAEGLNAFGRKMRCYGDGGAILTAPETRTSSPIRIPRGGSGVTESADNLYPCGEGAGYAGGIMSAAVDGVNTALAIMARFAPAN